MSKYCEYQTKIDDQDCLVAGLNEMGFPTVESHLGPHQLMGYENALRPESAEVIIRKAFVGGASNDIGFAKRGSAFEAIISDFDSRRYNQAWLNKLSQQVAIKKIEKLSRVHGNRVIKKETISQNGHQVVRMQVQTG